MNMHLARNKKGELKLFRWIPKYSERLDMWYEEHLEDGYGNMTDTEYPEVTFENSPMEVELKLIEK